VSKAAIKGNIGYGSTYIDVVYENDARRKWFSKTYTRLPNSKTKGIVS
jgi:hypothetical protein